MLKTRKRRSILLAVVALAVTAGAAFAVWTVMSSGTGAAKGAELTAPTISAGGVSFVADLYPSTEATGTLSFTATNPNAIPLEITNVAGTGGGSTSSPLCPIANVSVPSKAVTGVTLPAGASGVQVNVADAVLLDQAAPTACQGTEFLIGGLNVTWTPTTGP
jgi:hypothetical protein